MVVVLGPIYLSLLYESKSTGWAVADKPANKVLHRTLFK